MNLQLDEMPIELAYYGCASGILAISEAVNYCQKHHKACFVYVFDQCSWIFNPIYDADSSNFKNCLRAYSIFSDGAVGMLLIPEAMRDQYSHPLIKILELNKKFQLGNVITIENDLLLVRKGVAKTMPALTADLSIKPLLKKRGLNPEYVAEWSIHQGGIPVLEAFKKEKILGLSDMQIQRSKMLFQKYGNFSSPSCLYVLDSFFQDRLLKASLEQNQKLDRDPDYGMVTSFGAGYYLGSLLYQWE